MERQNFESIFSIFRECPQLSAQITKFLSLLRLTSFDRKFVKSTWKTWSRFLGKIGKINIFPSNQRFIKEVTNKRKFLSLIAFYFTTFPHTLRTWAISKLISRNFCLFFHTVLTELRRNQFSIILYYWKSNRQKIVMPMPNLR